MSNGDDQVWSSLHFVVNHLARYVKNSQLCGTIPLSNKLFKM